MYEMNEIDGLIEAFAMVLDEHGIMCEDGHWMTEEELYTLPDEEVLALYDCIYGKV